jgi:hypothetical protein
VEFYLQSLLSLNGMQVTWKESRLTNDLIQHSRLLGCDAASLGDFRRFERTRRLHLRQFQGPFFVDLTVILLHIPKDRDPLLHCCERKDLDVVNSSKVPAVWQPVASCAWTRSIRAGHLICFTARHSLCVSYTYSRSQTKLSSEQY